VSTRKSNPDIFISYSRDDFEKISHLFQWLNDHGYSVWWDKEIVGGSHWNQEIVEALDNSKILILVISKSSLNSNHVRKEVQIADEDGKYILPVALENLSLPSGFRYALVGRQILDFNSISFWESLEGVLKRQGIKNATIIQQIFISIDREVAIQKIQFEDLRVDDDAILSVPAKNTMHLIEEFSVHSCPDDERHDYKPIRFIAPRNGRGEFKRVYEIQKVLTFKGLKTKLGQLEGLECLEKIEQIWNSVLQKIKDGTFLPKSEFKRLEGYIKKNTHWANERYYLMKTHKIFSEAKRVEGEDHIYLDEHSSS